MSALRELPSVDRLLSALPDLEAQYGHALTREAVRSVIEAAREAWRSREEAPPGFDALVQQTVDTLAAWLTPTLRRAINATGVIIHTNLGRAPLSEEALAAIQAVGQGYSTLEYDLEEGARGERSQHAEALLTRLTGAEAAFVVNNNAAATMLTLAALASGRGAIIARGQLVEIGGGYRMPDVMAASGARMVEIGTTNRTHLRDYERAIDEQSALLLRVHHSNYAIIGFTTEPGISELAELAHAHGLVLVDDIGSGAMLDSSRYGIAREPIITESLEQGADLVLFSGDKLLGGPQAGIIVGKAGLIAQIRRHPLARAMRPDKLCLAGLSATLTHYLRQEAIRRVPVWRMIATTPAEIKARAESWAAEIRAAGLLCELIEGQSAIGGGSLPGQTLPTWLLAIDVLREEEAAAALRAGDPPVIVRREAGHLLIDPRTVLPRDEPDLIAALRALLPFSPTRKDHEN